MRRLERLRQWEWYWKSD